MAFTFNSFTLKNELKPVKFTYGFETGKEETLSKRFVEYKDISFVEHKLLLNSKDINVSRSSCLALSETLPLNNIFDPPKTPSLALGQIPGTFKIKVTKGLEYTYLHESNLVDIIIAPFSFLEERYKDHILTPLNFSLVPRPDYQGAEIVANGNRKLYRDLEYPYNIRLSIENITEVEKNRKIFFVTNKYKEQATNGSTLTNVSFSNNVDNEDGSNVRFLSISQYDGILRAIGTTFNNFKLNDYIFEAEFLSEQEINYNYSPQDLYEIKYISNYPSKRNNGNLTIKQAEPANANFLASCALENIPDLVSANKKVPLNIATLKTNFSTTGVYNIS